MLIHRQPLQRLTRSRWWRAILALLLAGCASIAVKPNGPGRSVTVGADRTPRIPRTGDEAQDADRHGTPAAAVARREVVAKEPPSALLAQDGTRCTVDPEKYERTKVGDRVLCVWTKNPDDPTS
jgi:hypothetical protein